MASINTAVSMHKVTKSFPGVLASDQVSIDFEAGEIHALLGENGAGKSTLMNVLTGIYRQDDGDICVKGKKVTFNNAADAIAAGIGMVHQHFKLVKAFSVAQNLHLGSVDTPRFFAAQDLNVRAAELSARFGLDVDPSARVEDLSAGEQQRVEILRVLSRGTDVLIVDEPTAVLTPVEVESLLQVLRELKSAGCCIIFISHKLDEVLSISDRVTVLRGGKHVATHNSNEMTTQSLAQLMVGRNVIFERMARLKPVTPRREVLRLENISAYRDSGAVALDNVGLSVQSHQILGIAGVAGNGQRTLSEIITGVRQASTGQVIIDGALAPISAADVAELGVGHIPEDRLKSGFAGDLSVADNAVLRCYKQAPVARGAWYNFRAAVNTAKTMVADADVSPADVDVPLRNLSGGNQQRLIARRECLIADRLLVAVYPMRGLDVGAVGRLRQMIIERRDAGAAVILISEELDELFEMADRIAVLHHGRIIGESDVDATNREEIGLMMGGQRRQTEQSQ